MHTQISQFLDSMINQYPEPVLPATLKSSNPKPAQDVSIGLDAAEDKRLETLRVTLAHDHQQTLRRLNETVWSDVAIAKIPHLDLAKFAYQCSAVLREEFHTFECFEAYWRNLSRRKIRRSAHDERWKR